MRVSPSKNITEQAVFDSKYVRSLKFERLMQRPGDIPEKQVMKDHAFFSQIPALLGWDQKGRVTSSALPQEAPVSCLSHHRMEFGPFFLEQLAGASKRLYSENPTNGTGNRVL